MTMAKLNLYAFIFSLTLIAFAEAGLSEDSREAKALYNELFAGPGLFKSSRSKDATLSTKETHEKLLKLSQLTPLGSMKTSYDVDQLVEAHFISLDKCTLEHFGTLNRLLNDQYRKAPNIVLYLKEIKANQFKTCDELYRVSLQDRLNNINSKLMFDMFEIYKGVMRSGYSIEKPYSNIPQEAIVKSVATFLVKRAHSSQDSQIAMFDAKNDWNKLVNDVCENIEYQARDPLRFYEPFFNDEETITLADSWTIEWLTNSRICRDISGNGHNDIREKAFKLFKELLFKESREGDQ